MSKSAAPCGADPASSVGALQKVACKPLILGAVWAGVHACAGLSAPLLATFWL